MRVAWWQRRATLFALPKLAESSMEAAVSSIQDVQVNDQQIGEVSIAARGTEA